jgi:acetylornithine deacetylase/succinyl-diaminopimelate desuccinylase-like protein
VYELPRIVVYLNPVLYESHSTNFMKKYTLIILLGCITSHLCTAQSSDVVAIRNYGSKYADKIVREFASFLALPNIAHDTAHIKKNAAFIMDMMTQRGIKNVQLLAPATAGAPPAVYGEVKVPGATQTLIFYAHYDGQPVNPAQWAKGLEPFQPRLYTGAIDKNGTNIPFPTDGKYQPDWRIYARSASDDKAGVFTIINAYEALTKSGLQPTSNLKFFFEGEEEAGSPHLDQILEKHKALLSSDLWIICDGPVHQSGKKQIVFGVRGDAHIDLTVYGPRRPLHSGHYGNWAPNPALMLASLLASMKDEAGRVTIKGFYDDVIPLSTTEQKAMHEVPSVEEQMKKELGLSAIEMPGVLLGEAISQPSLNINGMQSGNVGKMASNQIPTYATAVLDLRLVLGNDWQRQQQKVVDHIRAQGYHVIDHDPTDAERATYAKLAKVLPGNDGYNAQRTSMDLPIARKVIKAVQTTTSTPLVLQPTSGGSLPLYLFEKYLGAQTITVPIANHDNNQHAENENIRLGNLFEGLETMSAVMRMR